MTFSSYAPLGLKSIYGKILGMLSLLVTGEATAETSGLFSEKDESAREKRMGFFFLVFCLVVGLAFLIGYLQQKQSHQ